MNGVLCYDRHVSFSFFFQAEDGIRDRLVTGVQTCALHLLVTGVQTCALPILCVCVCVCVYIYIYIYCMCMCMYMYMYMYMSLLWPGEPGSRFPGTCIGICLCLCMCEIGRASCRDSG